MRMKIWQKYFEKQFVSFSWVFEKRSPKEWPQTYCIAENNLTTYWSSCSWLLCAEITGIFYLLHRVSVVLETELRASFKLSIVPPTEPATPPIQVWQGFVCVQWMPECPCVPVDLCNVGVQTTEGAECHPPSLSALLVRGNEFLRKPVSSSNSPVCLLLC